MPAPADAAQIARELRFDASDMEQFAAASGDLSPLHTDPEFGRRTAFGRCIAYGGLETIALLGLLPKAVQARVRRVRSSFPGAVLPDVPCAASARPRPGRPDEWEIALSARGKVLARVAVSAEEAAERPRVGDDQSPAAHDSPRLAPGEEFEGPYRVGAGLAELAARLGAGQVAPAILEGICWASHAVGMSIPGFDGLCAAVSVSAGRPQGGDGARQHLRIRDHDPRTDRIVLDGTLFDASGAPRCHGVIECFPFTPTPVTDIASHPDLIPPDPNAGAVVVVGGNRGLGSALALALLARGHRVHVVYSVCDSAAKELQRLAEARSGALTLHCVDAADPLALAAVAAAVEPELAGLVLCAAPTPLPMALTLDTAGELSAYVAETVRLAATPLSTFGPLLRRPTGWMVFCSAAAVAEPIRELPQFGPAKAAIEGLAHTAAGAFPSAPVLVARLPRMRTDLVNTPSGRARAVRPDAIAAELADHLAADLEAGVTVLTPSGAVVGAS